MNGKHAMPCCLFVCLLMFSWSLVQEIRKIVDFGFSEVFTNLLSMLLGDAAG